MDHFKATAISAAGMAAQMARIEAATLNLANMNTSSAPGAAGYRPVKAVIRAVPASFAQRLDGGIQPATSLKAELQPQQGLAPRSAFEPGHPHADAQGMVSYPAVDPTQEMITVMTALRSYEANLAALRTTRTLAAKALEIGGQ